MAAETTFTLLIAQKTLDLPNGKKFQLFLTFQSRTINQCWLLLASALKLSTVDGISSQSSSSVKFTTSVHFPQIVFFFECQFFQRANFSRFVLVQFEIKFDENPCRSDSRTEFHGGGKFAVHVEIYVNFFLCLRFRLSNVFSALRAESNAIYMPCMLRLSQLFVRQHWYEIHIVVGVKRNSHKRKVEWMQ